MKARRGDDPRLAALPRAEQRTLEVATGTSGHQLASVSQVFGGIAETSTLVLASGPDNPATLNVLPDTHIVVVAGDIAGD
jgi:L-lactate dehydrogenase complex protein LldG